MRKTLDLIYNCALTLAGVFLVGVFILMISEPVVRWFGGYILGANDMIGWFCAAAGFLAFPSTFQRGEMIRVGILVDKLNPLYRKPLLIICLLIAVVFIGYMTVAVIEYLIEGWRGKDLTQGMILIPVWIPQISFLLGATLLCVAIVDSLISTLKAPASKLLAEKPVEPGQQNPH